MLSTLAQELPGHPNPLYAALDRLRAGQTAIVDLIKGNVNDHGICFPQDVMESILIRASARARVYHPDSFGQGEAREAISAYYGGAAPASQVLITPGTSISYWYCFKLLAEPGDAVLCPKPSYPLFDYIAKLSGVELRHYRIAEGARWSIDVDSMVHAIDSRTKAIVLISPHNPTGSVATREEIAALADIAAKYRIAIIADEVFSEFLFTGAPLPRPAASTAPLVLTLNGLSKMYALPGMKVGWIAVTGDPEWVRPSLAALEMISDTFLPVNETAQFAVKEIFERGGAFLKNYRGWIEGCRQAALESLQGVRFATPEGGFYVTLPIPGDEDPAALRLLQEAHILVHPGYFYDVEPNHLVMTFIGPHPVIRESFAQIRGLACA